MSSTLDRALFRLRGSTVEFWPLLASWQLSVVLMIAAAFWYVLLAVFAFLGPLHVAQSIAGLWMFRLLYALLLLNTGACILTRIRRLTIGTLLVHLSFFLIALGFLLTATSRYEATYRVAEGEELTGADDQIVSRSVPRVMTSAPPAMRFRVAKIAPQLWRGQLLFTSLEATLDGGRTTRINRPLLLGPATFLRLSGFGYAPRYEIADGRGAVLESGFAKVAVFPPGARDFIAPAHFPFRFYLSSDDLYAERMRVQVYRGRLLLASGTIARGETIAFEGLRFRIAEVRHWGELTLVRDAGALPLFLGFLLGLIGLATKLRFVPVGAWSSLRTVTLVAFVVALIAWIARWRAAGHLPLFGTYESSLSMAVAVLGVAFLFNTPIAMVIAALLVAEGFLFDRTVYALTISERSLVVDIHAFLAWIAFAVLTANAALALRTLVRPRDGTVSATLLSHTLSLGFLVYSAMLATGSLYQFMLFGTAWNFDPIETLGLASWLAYGTLLHLHLMAKWNGRRLAQWSLGIFVLLVVSYRAIILFPPTSTFHILDINRRVHVSEVGR